MNFPFHPLQVTLRATRRARLGHHPAAMICQLLKAAAGAAGLGTGFPRGIIPDPVEVGRLLLDPGQTYAFGLTLADPDQLAGLQRWQRLLAAIESIGQADAAPGGTPPRGVGLGGNFTIERVQSLVDPACPFGKRA